MLTSLRLSNFRRFDGHEVPLKSRTVIVGPNNAGKSTIIEAIRLVALVANRLRSLQFTPVPSWLTDPVGARGVSPSLRDLNTNLRTAFHRFADPPAVIEARFVGDAAISVFVGPDERVFAVVRDPSGRVVTSREHAYRFELPRVAIQPQVGPLGLDERVLDPDTVRRGLDSPLAPSHFRNQLRFVGEPAVTDFRSLAEETWPGLQVRDLLVPRPDEPRGNLALFVRDGEFVGEAAAMGHGLQMWLQVMWFLARNREAPTIVLDEPDVYLHADLQRKLMRQLQSFHQQVIVATHSVEIMSEVEPSNLLTVNSRIKRSTWASSLSGVQRMIDNLGGVHNVQLSRLANARRCLFLEGEDDVEILRRVHDSIMPTADALDVLPRLRVGGWDGWQQVVGCAGLLRNSAGDSITPFSIFDSDYHPPANIVARYSEAANLKVRLHVWRHKEIENYLLVPPAIQRVIAQAVADDTTPPTVDAVATEMQALLVALEDAAFDACATAYKERNRGATVATANQWARRYIRARLREPDSHRGVVSGKEALRRLSSWADAEFGVTFGATAVARELQPDEVDGELRDVLMAVERRREIATRHHAAWAAREAEVPTR